ncbi:hypothetical protein OIU34_27055 [Pararhizobium sp. BT-229]|uniref:hypothetical protein n=1 Tax=Pararhizobium sp. BT-229 TaxID=2986923 RepID=UPI0021F7F391|nr:hypothetical protein [Pararhizobium sp. BT-229]MCV9965542.1 hypothetical protein [Pararhizobium sp. BT-229]
MNIQFSAVSGAGSLAVVSSRRWIVTRRLDLETRRSLSIQCNAYEAHCGKARVSQSARLVAVETGTALVAQGALENGLINALDRVGVEQKVGKLNLGAAVTQPASAPRGTLTASYAFTW